MNTPEELKSQKQKQSPNKKSMDQTTFSGSVQRTQLKAEDLPDVKNKLKAVVQPEYTSLERPTVRR